MPPKRNSQVQIVQPTQDNSTLIQIDDTIDQKIIQENRTAPGKVTIYNQSSTQLVESQQKITYNNDEDINRQQQQTILNDKPQTIPIWEQWEDHQPIKSRNEFMELMEIRYYQIKRQSSKLKYITKIGFQIFIYILNCLELIFTLYYGTFNSIEGKLAYNILYQFSIYMTILIHCLIFMYIYKYMKIQEVGKSYIQYFLYMLLGGLSYLKLAPFYLFFTRNKQIEQFSFSQINKYLQLTDDRRLENPTGLYKYRDKPVNIFRDFIFHRAFVLSLMIELVMQILPQLFIQGFYNSQTEWNVYNVFSFIFLLSMLFYSITELQFIVLTTTYKYIKTELQIRLQQLRVNRIQETKQLIKAKFEEISSISSYFFSINVDKFTSYDKKRCMIQIIYFLMQFKKIGTIEISHIDIYDILTLQYLANALKFLHPFKAKFIVDQKSNYEQIKSIFIDINNVEIICQEDDTPESLWKQNYQMTNSISEQEKNQGIFFENKQKYNRVIIIYRNTKQFNLLQPQISKSFTTYLIQDEQKFQSIETILKQSKEVIAEITQKKIYEETLGWFSGLVLQYLYKFIQLQQYKSIIEYYEYYEQLISLNKFQWIFQSLDSFLNVFGQVFQYIYLFQDKDMFTIALILLQILNPLIQQLSFSFFYIRLNPMEIIQNKIGICIMFFVFNVLKIWDLVMIIIYFSFSSAFQTIKRTFTYNAYKKFIGYSAKFEGNISLLIMIFQIQQIDEKKSLENIKNQPFYQSVMWRTSVEEALNKIPQFFIYILQTTKVEDIDFYWLISFIQSIKEGIRSILDILVTVVQDNFIQSLILRKISVQQFYQSLGIFALVDQQVLIEYPKSFQLISKVDSNKLYEANFKMNLANLNFDHYKQLKQKKMLAQMSSVLCRMNGSLEIQDAQHLYFMETGLNDIINCLRVSQLDHLKLNFNLECINLNCIENISSIFQFCPQTVKIFQIQFTFKQYNNNIILPLSLFSELIGFGFTCTQLKQQYYKSKQIIPQDEIIISNQLCTVDKQNFAKVYFEFQGNLNMSQCQTFFKQFTSYNEIIINLENDLQIQQFNFEEILNSNELKRISITLENFKIDMNYSFSNILDLKLIFVRCEFNQEQFIELIQTIQQGDVYIDLRLCQTTKITKQQKSEIMKNLESKGIYAVIYI